MTAKKNDQGKIDLSIVPLAAMESIAKGLTYGAQKYGRYNYFKGHRTTQLIAACLRHLAAYNEGEDLDTESGNSHIDHAIATLAMLQQQLKLGTLTDDRYKKPD